MRGRILILMCVVLICGGVVSTAAGGCSGGICPLSTSKTTVTKTVESTVSAEIARSRVLVGKRAVGKIIGHERRQARRAGRS